MAGLAVAARWTTQHRQPGHCTPFEQHFPSADLVCVKKLVGDVVDFQIDLVFVALRSRFLFAQLGQNFRIGKSQLAVLRRFGKSFGF